MRQLVIKKPDDFHLHLRDFPEAANYLSHSAKNFARALVMPNTTLPIDSVERLIDYKNQIKAAAPNFEPIMSFKLTPKISISQIADFKKAGAMVAKYYPGGVTTNSSDGALSIRELFPQFEQIEKEGLILSVHGEEPQADVFNRERKFLESLDCVIKNFPNLKIVMEHISTKEAGEFILSQGENVAATITAHHLYFCANDLMGGAFNPHLFCKPILQGEVDKIFLQKLATSGNSKFFFGSDSAPHLKSKKEGAACAAGIYSAPVALEVLATVFDSLNALEKLEDFTSRFGALFYGLSQNDQTIVLKNESYQVADEYFGVVPMLAGQQLNWRVEC